MPHALCPSGRIRRAVITVGGAVGVGAALVVVLLRRREEFAVAIQAAPVAILVAAAVLQLVAIVARTEAWHVCVQAAGGTLGRRRLFRAASLGYLASQLNTQLAAAARIAALRRAAPAECPRVPALIAAELPILVAEGALAAIASFTLVGPLGLPWWVPIPCLAVALLVVSGLRRLSRRRGRSFWTGLAVLSSMGGRTRMLALVLVAVFAQIARNWLMLRALGIHASVFDATAVLIAMVILAQLPVGPSVGAAAVVAILGADGLATTAAAGVLLTATGTAGALAYVAWAGADRLWAWRRRSAPAPRPAPRRRRTAPVTVERAAPPAPRVAAVGAAAEAGPG